VLLLFAQFAFCAEPTIAILGDVVGNGKTEMKAAFNQWISVSGKPYPVIDGAHLKAGDGAMSIVFRDGARLEAGKYTDFTVAGSKGSYSISMESGTVGFSVPQGVALTVTTPTSTIQAHSAAPMIQKASLSSQGQVVKGVVSHNDKGTKVMAVSGTLTVRSGIGVAVQTVSEGNAIYIEKTDGGKIITTQMATTPPPAPATTPPPPAVSGPPSGAIWPDFFIVAGLTAAPVWMAYHTAFWNYSVTAGAPQGPNLSVSSK
jgi:hypothetical protein